MYEVKFSTAVSNENVQAIHSILAFYFLPYE